MMRAKRSPSIDYLDEVNEANWSPESIVNQPKELYEPVCLCLVSRYPFFDILQVCGCIRVALLSLGERSVLISEVA